MSGFAASQSAALRSAAGDGNAPLVSSFANMNMAGRPDGTTDDGRADGAEMSLALIAAGQPPGGNTGRDDRSDSGEPLL